MCRASPRERRAVPKQGSTLSPAQKALIEILAEAAVEQFLAEHMKAAQEPADRPRVAARRGDRDGRHTRGQIRRPDADHQP